MRKLHGRTSEDPDSRFVHLARLALIALAATAAACVAGEAGAQASLASSPARFAATIDGELAVPGLEEPVE